MIFNRGSSEDATIVAVLAAALRRDISFGTLRPDQKLKINDLRSRYGGSNHSMRETLRVLTAEGLVEATSQRGFRVTSATLDDMQDIALVRIEVEKVALSRSFAHGDVAWEGRVIAAHHGLSKAEKDVIESADDQTALDWDEACRAFAFALISACESPRLIELQRRFFDQSRRFRLALLRETQLDFASRAGRQQGLLNAALSRDTPTAQALWQQDIEADLSITS